MNVSSCVSNCEIVTFVMGTGWVREKTRLVNVRSDLCKITCLYSEVGRKQTS